jgi:hypothetical protein
MGRSTADIKTEVPDVLLADLESIEGGLDVDETFFRRFLILRRLYGQRGVAEMHGQGVIDKLMERAQALPRRALGGGALPPWLSKSTEPVKVRVPDCVKVDFARTARTLGLSESEFFFRLIRNFVYGDEQVRSMEQAHAAMVAGSSPERVQA